MQTSAIPDDFPGNSYNKRQVKPPEKGENNLNPSEEGEETPKPSKVELSAVASGKKRKKNAWEKLKAMATDDDNKTVGGYILRDVLLPSIRDLVYDVITQGASRKLYGSSRGAPRRGGGRDRDRHVSYEKMYDDRRGRDRHHADRDRGRSMSRQARSRHSFEEVEFDTRAEADMVISTLSEQISRYGVATVSDLYTLSDITPEPIDNLWGWETLRDARAVRNRYGMYTLELPPSERLD